jgi:CRISPR-associated protein Cas8b1/Cst1 subtype I-B
MNAGILGYLRLTSMAKKKPDLSRGYIEIHPNDLERFNELYFTAVLMRVAKGIISFRSDTYSEIRPKISNKDITDLKKRLTHLEETSFRKIKPNYNQFDSTLSSVIIAANDFREQSNKLCDTRLSKYQGLDRKHIDKIKRKFNTRLRADIKRLRDKKQNFIYTYLNSFYRNKNIIGNPATGKARRKNAFSKVYVKPTINLLKLSDNKGHIEGFLCRFCKQNRVIPKSFDDVNNIFSEGMFSTTTVTISFKNFFYNMQPDLFVCDVCELLLLCAWIGFTEVPYRFQDQINNTGHIFVNLPSLKLLWDENEKIRKIYDVTSENVQGTIYQDIIQDIFLHERRTKGQWTLANIMFIEIKTTRRKDSQRPNFRYFHIGRDIATLFTDELAIDAFSRINGRVNIDDFSVNLRRDVVRRILDHVSLFPLCNALLSSHLSTSNPYSLGNVFNILVISSIRDYIKIMVDRNENLVLESREINNILRDIQREGNTFVGEMKFEARKRKSYILLSMIRNSRVEDFYDILMNIYMSQNRPIPGSLIQLLNRSDEIGFRVKAYAFMSGFLAVG